MSAEQQMPEAPQQDGGDALPRAPMSTTQTDLSWACSANEYLRSEPA